MSASPVIIVDDADPAIDYGTPDLWNHTKYVGNFYDATYSAGYTNATAKLSFNGMSSTAVFEYSDSHTDSEIAS